MPQGILPFQLEAERDKTKVTAVAGLLPVIELMMAAGVLDSANRHIGIRAESDQGWTDAQLVMAVTLLNLVGGAGVSDLDVLDGDRGLGAIVRSAELRGLTGRERRDFRRRFRGGADPPWRIWVMISGISVLEAAAPQDHDSVA